MCAYELAGLWRSAETPPPSRREAMPLHHVTAGLLYKGHYLSSSLSEGSDSDQLANISAEELGGECSLTPLVFGVTHSSVSLEMIPLPVK